jgi:hypothetical protein
MRQSRVRALMLMASLTMAATASGQFGHPLKGSWSGDWGPTKEQRTRLLVELNWDGNAVTGAVNPGPNALTLTTASLDADTWKVHLQAQGKDRAGRVVQATIDGTLDNIGAYRRVLSGTWTQGGVKGDFRLVLN